MIGQIEQNLRRLDHQLGVVMAGNNGRLSAMLAGLLRGAGPASAERQSKGAGDEEAATSCVFSV